MHWRLSGVGVIGGTVIRGACQNAISCSYPGFLAVCMSVQVCCLCISWVGEMESSWGQKARTHLTRCLNFMFITQRVAVCVRHRAACPAFSWKHIESLSSLKALSQWLGLCTIYLLSHLIVFCHLSWCQSFNIWLLALRKPKQILFVSLILIYKFNKDVNLTQNFRLLYIGEALFSNTSIEQQYHQILHNLQMRCYGWKQKRQNSLVLGWAALKIASLAAMLEVLVS